jgi:hypothetical protein
MIDTLVLIDGDYDECCIINSSAKDKMYLVVVMIEMTLMMSYLVIHCSVT